MFVHLCSFKNRASSCRQSDVFYIAGKLYQFILYLIEVLVECASATVLLRLVKALATTQCKARRPSAQLHLGLLSECEMWSDMIQFFQLSPRFPNFKLPFESFWQHLVVPNISHSESLTKRCRLFPVSSSACATFDESLQRQIGQIELTTFHCFSSKFMHDFHVPTKQNTCKAMQLFVRTLSQGSAMLCAVVQKWHRYPTCQSPNSFNPQVSPCWLASVYLL